MDILGSFLRTSCCVGLAVIATFTSPQFASADVSFADKKINVLIGSAAGGGTDGTTRLVGQFFTRYLPGNPVMVYRNMPAGRGVQAHNYFYAKAATDGTFWIGGGASHVDPTQLQRSATEYKPTEYEYIGGIARDGGILIVNKSKVPNLTNKQLPPAIIGGTDGSRDWEQMMLWGAEYLGWNIKFVVGYGSSGALNLAGRRGEIDAFGDSKPQVLSDLFGSGSFVGFVQLGDRKKGQITESLAYEDIPVMSRLMEGKVSGNAKDAFDLWRNAGQLDKFYSLPPKTDKDVVKAYHAAWTKLGQDKEFLEIGAKQFGDDFSLQSGDEVMSLVKATAYPRPETLTVLQDLKAKYGLPSSSAN